MTIGGHLLPMLSHIPAAAITECERDIGEMTTGPESSPGNPERGGVAHPGPKKLRIHASSCAQTLSTTFDRKI
jgi:hypothetical protein